MTGAGPVIAVSAGFPAYGDYMGLAYGRPLEAAGAVPVHLPFLNDTAGVLAVAGGVLLGFGSDIEPALCLALRVLVTGFASTARACADPPGRRLAC